MKTYERRTSIDEFDGIINSGASTYNISCDDEFANIKPGDQMIVISGNQLTICNIISVYFLLNRDGGYGMTLTYK